MEVEEDQQGVEVEEGGEEVVVFRPIMELLVDEFTPGLDTE